MRIAITGAGGMLARALVPALEVDGHDILAFVRAALDVTDDSAVRRALTHTRPDVVIQCAAYTRVDDAEREYDQALRVNATATAHVAAACRDIGARLVYPGTDYVFDGSASVPYRPHHATAPVNAYGRTKLAGEHAAATVDALIVRTSWLYGRGGRNFVRTIATRAREGRALRVVCDQRGAPTSTRSLAATIAALIAKQAPAGIYHATNAGETTWYGLATATLELAGISADITPVTSQEFVTPARRPQYSVLDCSTTWAITGRAPDWRDALADELDHGLLDD